jgi:WD40 repeat protein
VVHASDGSLIATATGTAIALWDPASGRQIRHLDLRKLQGENRSVIGEYSSVQSLTFFAEGRTLIAGLSDGFLQYLDVATGKLDRTLPLNDPNQPKNAFDSFLDFHLSPDGRHVSTLGQTFTRELVLQLRLWETDSGKLVRSDTFPARQPRVWKSLGMKWVLPMVDGLAIVDVISGQIQVRVPGTWIPPLAASPDYRLLAGRISQNPRPTPAARSKRRRPSDSGL